MSYFYNIFNGFTGKAVENNVSIVSDQKVLDATPTNILQKKQDAVDRTFQRLKQFHIPAKQFITEMIAHGGVIAGSFMLMNYTDNVFDFGDIDVYFYNDPKYDIGNITSPCENYFHPFEQYL
ncbi:hypothetical protein EON71_01320, partial [bacterium]